MAQRPFDFLAFAKQIHGEIGTSLDKEPYLLPALYGGELGPNSDRFDAIIVLHEPLLSLTRELWGEPNCSTTEMAIQRHRKIFVYWAYRRQPFHFFNFLDKIHSHEFMPSADAFFSHYYVTDTWKDAAPKQKRGDDGYRTYWRSKLELELKNVPTKRIILVGLEAANEEVLGFCNGAITHQTVFPSQKPHGVLQAALAKLGDEIRASMQ